MLKGIIAKLQAWDAQLATLTFKQGVVVGVAITAAALLLWAVL